LDLSHALGWSQPSSTVNKIPFRTDVVAGEHLDDVNAPQIEVETVEEAYSNLSERITKLHASLPPRSALIIFTGHDDPRQMSQLMAKKTKFDKLWKAKRPSEIAPEDCWMEEEDRQLQTLAEKTRIGLSFFCVT
jgi:RNA exonuclease 1